MLVGRHRAGRGERLLHGGRQGRGPGMAVAGQMGRTYHPGPLTLRISLRSGRDNRGYIGLPGVGTTVAEKR
jgi:hypothetical protein